MSNKIKNNVRKEFTIIPNALINDNSLTDRARFLFCYMASKPEGWDFYQVPLCKQLGYSLDTLRKYTKELIESGWVSREERREEGKFNSFDYTLHPSPCGKNTDTVKNRIGKKPHRENSQLYKKDYNKERIDTNKEEVVVEEESWPDKILADEMFLETVRRMHKMKNEDVAAALDSFLLQKRGLGEANWPTYSQFRKNFLFWIPKANNNAPNRRADVSRTPPTVWNTDNARQAFLELCAEDGIDVSEAMRAFAAGGGGGD